MITQGQLNSRSRLSRRPVTGVSDLKQAGADRVQWVTCRVDQEDIAFDIHRVQEIHRMMEMTPVPKAPPFVEGVINLRGRIVPVVNVRRRLGMPDGACTASARIVVVTVQQQTWGLLVDHVAEVLELPQHLIEPPPALGDSRYADFVQGVGRLRDRLVTLINLDRLLGRDDGALAPVRLG
jgi:purine-binding chemotaxis protein CheW